MATYFARKAGNINAADVWATTPSGTASNFFPTFTSSDVLMANGFTVTVNVSATVAEVRNDNTGGASASGTFSLSNGVTLTANAFGGSWQGVFCINANNLTPGQTASFVGNLTNGSGHADMVSFGSTGAGTVNITGNLIGGVGAAGRNYGALIGGPTTINFNGNITGGSGANGISEAMQLNHVSAVLNFQNGNIIGGSGGGGTTTSSGNHGVNIVAAASVTINGNVVGGGVRSGGSGTHAGVFNASASAIVNITGNSIGGTFFPGVQNFSTGTVRVTRAVGNAYGPGNTTNLASAVGVTNSGLGVIEVEQLEFGTYGQSPTSGTGIRLKKTNSNVAVFNYADTAGAKTLIDATANAAMPAATNVRSGVSYASGALVGTCAVPAAGSVSLGVPVDNTTGTAILTQADVQSALTAQGLTTARAGNLDNLDTTVSSRLAPSGTLATVTTLTNAPSSVTASDIWSYATRTTTGGTVDTLTNAPSVPSASAIASQVRTELSVELARIDAATSTRATPANIPTADIAAIKVKTDALNTTRLAQVSTTEIVGSLLAQANS